MAIKKICKDGRVWGQTNAYCGSHLGIAIPRSYSNYYYYSKKGAPKTHWWRSGGEFKKGFGKSVKSAIKSNGYNRTFNIEFKELIIKRDNYSCQICGCPQAECLKNLDVHHIDYDKTNDNPLNLISLCLNCHLKTRFRMEYWKQYFSDKKKEKF